ncbi:MAG: hypothetical protein K9M44_05010 [Candidatus Pacebacteria bacterium]|nr:hypothetical protein [Candidatus Paceibacterota bacterium]
MLSHLFSSNARVKILKTFLLNSDKKYYIRQLARELGLQVNSVRRELDNLETFGLLTTNLGQEIDDFQLLEEQFKDLSGDERRLLDIARIEAKNKSKKTEPEGKQEKKYYQVNTKFILFKEIRDLFVKAQILSGRSFVKKLYKICQPKYLALTGVFLNQNSATDILLVGAINRTKLKPVIKELEEDLGVEVNYTILSTKEFKYRQEITDVFLYQIMQGKKIVLNDEISESEKRED